MPNEEDVRALAEVLGEIDSTRPPHYEPILIYNRLSPRELEALARRALEFAEERLQEFFKRDHEDHIKQLKALKELKAQIESLRFGH